MQAFAAAPRETGASFAIESITARAVVAPLARPIRTAVGHIPAAPLVLIDLRTDAGIIGRSYIFAYTKPALRPLVSLIVDIGDELKGQAVAPGAVMAHLDRRFRLVGWQGLIGMAVSGIDMALWDVLARAHDVPLVSLLGGKPAAIPAYDSFGVVDLKSDLASITRSVESGFRAIKIKLGDGDMNADVETVARVRDAIGTQTALMVDYNQSLDVAEARRRIARIAQHDILWVEEPVAAEDIHGHARVRQASPVLIQTGENWWFWRDMEKAIAAGASDFAMLDLMKIGGVTGWMRASALAQAASLPVSSHIFNELSAHVLPVTPTAHFIEHLDIAGAILSEPLAPVNGTLTPRGPGFGIAWDEKAVALYAA